MATGLKQESQTFLGIRPELLRTLTQEQQNAVKFLPEKYKKTLDTLLGRQKEVEDGRRLWQAEDPSSIKSRVDQILLVAKVAKEKSGEVKHLARVEDSATAQAPKVPKLHKAEQEFPIFTGIRQNLLETLTSEQQEDVAYLPEKYKKALDSLLGRKNEIQGGRRLWPGEDPRSIDTRIDDILAVARVSKNRADGIKAQARGEGAPPITAASTLEDTISTV